MTDLLPRSGASQGATPALDSAPIQRAPRWVKVSAFVASVLFLLVALHLVLLHALHLGEHGLAVRIH